jgi:hypothetical protein
LVSTYLFWSAGVFLAVCAFAAVDLVGGQAIEPGAGNGDGVDGMGISGNPVMEDDASAAALYLSAAGHLLSYFWFGEAANPE